MTSKSRTRSRSSSQQTESGRAHDGPAPRSLLVGKPVVIAELDPQVASKIVERVAERCATKRPSEQDDSQPKGR